MSGYEEEHNIPRSATTSTPEDAPRRPDLSSFFAQLNEVSAPDAPARPHAIPMPLDLSALYTQLANAFNSMSTRPPQNDSTLGIETPHGEISQEHAVLLEHMVDDLLQSARDPPRDVEGVPDSYLDELERVPKKSLAESEACPICGNPFLEDPYPLVVRLPCHKDHVFDLECIRPWLKLKSTCPLDRQDLLKKKEVPRLPVDDEEDGEWDDMYA